MTHSEEIRRFVLFFLSILDCPKYACPSTRQANQAPMLLEIHVWTFTHRLDSFLTQDHLQAILVIFGRGALNFFAWKVLEKYENDTTFVRMCSRNHLGDPKMSKKASRFVEFNFLRIAIDEKRWIYKALPQNIKFLPRD